MRCFKAATTCKSDTGVEFVGDLEATVSHSGRDKFFVLKTHFSRTVVIALAHHVLTQFHFVLFPVFTGIAGFIALVPGKAGLHSGFLKIIRFRLVQTIIRNPVHGLARNLTFLGVNIGSHS